MSDEGMASADAGDTLSHVMMDIDMCRTAFVDAGPDWKGMVNEAFSKSKFVPRVGAEGEARHGVHA
jgi:hypothetical protein